MLKNPEDYKHLMPDSLTSFEHREDGFKFGLKGMPEVALKIAELVEGQKSSFEICKFFIRLFTYRKHLSSKRKTKQKFSYYLMEILIHLSK